MAIVNAVTLLQVLGLDSPASRGGVQEGDVVVSVQGELVTLLTHAQVNNTFCRITQLFFSEYFF